MRILETIMVASLFFSGAALAEGKHHGQVKQACDEDFQKYCPKASPSADRKAAWKDHMKCVKENMDKFSQPCQDELKKMKDKRGKHEEKALDKVEQEAAPK